MTKNKLPKNFKFIDLFAGIGGFRMGLERVGGKCVWSNDYDKYANKTYNHWFKDDINGLDINEAIKLNLVPPHDVLCGGFPCQPFSNAGHRKGFEDEKQGHLFFSIKKIVDEHEPKIIFLENVRNVFKKETFDVIHSAFKEDYICARALINAKAWVPQNRVRAFMLFFHREHFSEEFVLTKFQNFLDSLAQKGKAEDTPFISIRSKAGNLEEYKITKGTWAALQKHKARHLEAGRGFGYGLVDDKKPTRTLSARYAKDGAEILIKEPYWRVPRKITVEEGLALMGYNITFAKQYGFKRGFTFPETMSKAQIYKQLGNSLVPEIVSEIASILVKK